MKTNTATKVEELFYTIGTATTAKQLVEIESKIDSATNDLDERSELINQILKKLNDISENYRWN